jgi:hypothetical protein
LDSRNHEIDEGDVAEEVCYWKDMKMLPHAINLLEEGRKYGVRFLSPEEVREQLPSYPGMASPEVPNS